MNIVLIEDDARDIEKITHALIPLGNVIPYHLFPFQSINAGRKEVQKGNIDLILLDLEFTLAKESTIYLIDQIDPNIPIIVVSNLIHYQRQLRLKVNVSGFVPKTQLNQLVPSIIELLTSRNLISRPSDYIFPVSHKDSIPEAIEIRDILYIDVFGYKEYKIYYRGGTNSIIKSVNFKDLCQDISSKNIRELQPIARNQIINVNYIKEAHLEKNGRVSLTLIGVNNEFHVGKNYTNLFRDRYVD